MQVTYTLLPGLHGTAALFSPLVQSLDSPLTECIEYPTDIEQNYDKLEDWLAKNVDWSIPRVIIAESFSGPLALRIAKRFPASVKCLTLAATFCASPTSPKLALLPLRSFLMLSPPKRALKHFLIGDEANDSELSELKNLISDIPAKVLSQRVRAILSLEPNDCPCLKSLPILILQASDDNMIPWETQNQLRMRYDHATTHWLDGPHLILQRAPKECASLIKQFTEHHTNQPSYA